MVMGREAGLLWWERAVCERDGEPPGVNLFPTRRACGIKGQIDQNKVSSCLGVDLAALGVDVATPGVDLAALRVGLAPHGVHRDVGTPDSSLQRPV